MKSNVLRVAGLCLPFLFVSPAFAAELVFTTFSAGQGNTVADSINAEGTVAGTNGAIGFVRTREGKITTFLVDQLGVTGTPGVNRDGDVVGSYTRSGPNGFTRGFVRVEDGTMTTFDVGGVGVATLPAFINSAGEVAGTYYIGVSNGFVRSSQGAIETFESPTTLSLKITGLNSKGEIAATYPLYPYQSLRGSFIRYKDGTIVTVEVPGAVDTEAAGINDEGEIVGAYVGNGAQHGFVRNAEGKFTTLDLPGATLSPAAINNDGQIVGSFIDAKNVTHGFMRQRDGKIVTVDVPNATSTSVVAINVNGEMTGTYQTSAGATASFVARVCGCSP